MNCVCARVFAQALGKEEVKADIIRLCEVVESLRSLPSSSEGPYLCGARLTAADCMYAPIALRFRTYDPGNTHTHTHTHTHIHTHTQ